MAIKTDSTPLDQPKNPDQCTVFSLYNILASQAQVEALRQKYLTGGYGYGQAKQALLTLILEQFKTERQRFQAYIQDVSFIEQQLAMGEAKARTMAAQTLGRIRTKLGYAQVPTGK